MRTCAVTILSLAALATPALADSYANARFGYEITYPAGTFAPQPEPENGDGRHFTALQGGADLAVWGSWNANDTSADDIAAESVADCTGSAAPYKLVKATVVVVSCLTKDGVTYSKTLIRKDALFTFRFTYPAAEHDRWDKVIGQIKLAPAP